MAYHPLRLPSGLPADAEEVIRDLLEPQLVDVHSMFRLPIAGDPDLLGGCNLSIAQVLLSVVSGVSVVLYANIASGSGKSGELFKKVLEDHYPWDAEQHIVGAQRGATAAEQLYQIFRNPLAHALGRIDPKFNPNGRKVFVDKGPFAAGVIEADE